MPRIAPTDFECTNCGQEFVVTSEPVHCPCGTVSRVDGTVMKKKNIVRRPGDMIATVAKPVAAAAGLGNCEGCDNRRKWLNSLVK